MEVKKVETINPYNQVHMQLMEQFCSENNLYNILNTIQNISLTLEEEAYKQNYLNCSVIDDYIAIIDGNKITDCCMFHREKDMKKCFLTFPKLQNKKSTKDRKIVRGVIEYAISIGMEEVFVTASNQDPFLKENLENLGFISLGTEEEITPFVLTIEEKEKRGIVL